MNTSEIVCLSQSERQTFDQKREVMTGNRLPRDPTALFDLADRIANSLAEKPPHLQRVSLNTYRESPGVSPRKGNFHLLRKY